METNAYKFIADFQYLLEHGHDMSREDLILKVKAIRSAYHTQEDRNIEKGLDYCYGLMEYFGLYYRLEQLFGFGAHEYVRDAESHLAISLDSKEHHEYEIISVSSEESYLITNKIMNFISNEFLIDDSDEDSEHSHPLIRNKQVNEVEYSDLVMINECLIQSSRDFVKYIFEHKPEGWYWEEDMYCILQYIFDYFVEYTYKKTIHEDTSSLKCNILNAFSYRKPEVPFWLNERLNETVGDIQWIVYSINEYIKDNEFQYKDYKAWLRPIFITIGQYAIKFALEQSPMKQGSIDFTETYVETTK